MLLFSWRMPYSHGMTTIGKISLLVILAALFLPPVCTAAFPIGYGFSVSPLVGFLYGQAEELVYKDSKTNQYLSELLWDLKPLIYSGVAADFGPVDPFGRHGFISAFSFKLGLPLKAGIMEDRDWEHPQYDYQTKYSRHDTYFQIPVVLADLSAGYSWRLTNILAVGAYGELSYMRFSWSGKNGYTQYPEDISRPWSADLPKESVNGKIIQYTQNWFILSPGVSLNYNLSSLFSLGGNFSYSPLIYGANKDEHLQRRITFHDYLYFGHYFNGGGHVTFSPRQKIDFNLSFTYRHITGSRGDTYVNSVKDDGIAGAGYSVFDFGLMVKFYM